MQYKKKRDPEKMSKEIAAIYKLLDETRVSYAAFCRVAGIHRQALNRYFDMKYKPTESASGKLLKAYKFFKSLHDSGVELKHQETVQEILAKREEMLHKPNETND